MLDTGLLLLGVAFGFVVFYVVGGWFFDNNSLWGDHLCEPRPNQVRAAVQACDAEVAQTEAEMAEALDQTMRLYQPGRWRK